MAQRNGGSPRHAALIGLLSCRYEAFEGKSAHPEQGRDYLMAPAFEAKSPS